MKLISWNVNGLRAVCTKGFETFFNDVNADIFCLQETKIQANQVFLDFKDYYAYYDFAIKKGYSGTTVFTKVKPISVKYGMGIDFHDLEGRIITLEYETFFLVNVYTPNSQRKLERLSYRLQWEQDFSNYLKHLEKDKPVVVCGDLNVAHQEIDLKNPKTNHKNAGFTDQERHAFTDLLNKGFVDTYRYFYPNKTDAYTWWSYMHQARSRNIGWRIDYFLVSKCLTPILEGVYIYHDQLGSDHCPIQLTLKL